MESPSEEGPYKVGTQITRKICAQIWRFSLQCWVNSWYKKSKMRTYLICSKVEIMHLQYDHALEMYFYPCTCEDNLYGHLHPHQVRVGEWGRCSYMSWMFSHYKTKKVSLCREVIPIPSTNEWLVNCWKLEESKSWKTGIESRWKKPNAKLQVSYLGTPGFWFATLLDCGFLNFKGG